MNELERALDAPSREIVDPSETETPLTYEGGFRASPEEMFTEGDIISIRTERMELYHTLTVGNITEDGQVTFEPTEDRENVERLTLQITPKEEETPTVEDLVEERRAELEGKAPEGSEVRVSYDPYQVWEKISESTVTLIESFDFLDDAEGKERTVFTLVNQTDETLYGCSDNIVLSAFQSS
jgi:hypothetical protein